MPCDPESSNSSFNRPRLDEINGTKNWLLNPIRECNLQPFALVSLWVASKIHDTHLLSVNNLKLLGDKFIKEQPYTKGDLFEAFVSSCKEEVILDSVRLILKHIFEEAD